MHRYFWSLLFCFVSFSAFSQTTTDNQPVIHSSYYEGLAAAKAANTGVLVMLVDEKILTELLTKVPKDKLAQQTLIHLDPESQDELVNYFAYFLPTGRGIIPLTKDRTGNYTLDLNRSIDQGLLYAEKFAASYFKVWPRFVLHDPATFEHLTRLIPALGETNLHTKFFSADAFWYDHSIIPPAYQDAVPSVTGIRPNSSRLSLMVSNFFAEGNFPFPLDHTAGTRHAANTRIFNVIVLPRDARGTLLPIVYYRASTGAYHGGSRYKWTYPNETLVAEILVQRLPDGHESTFEVRVVRKSPTGWGVEAYRSHVDSNDLVAQLTSIPDRELPLQERQQLVSKIQDTTSLQPERQADAYGIFQTNGAQKALPAMQPRLVRRLLSRVFHPIAGYPWQCGDRMSCYCPTGPSQGVSIYPRGYQAGSLEVDSTSCKRCHSQTGKPLASYQFALTLYGNVWGSDERFSFHPFRKELISDTISFDSRGYGDEVIRQDFVRAGIIAPYNPAVHTNQQYVALD